VKWWRRKGEERLDRALLLLETEQRLNQILVKAVETQALAILELSAPKGAPTIYPQTVGIRVDPA
jgi:hypothetical protein